MDGRTDRRKEKKRETDTLWKNIKDKIAAITALAWGPWGPWGPAKSRCAASPLGGSDSWLVLWLKGHWKKHLS